MGGEPGGDNLLVTFGAAAGLASFSSRSICQAQGCPLTESPVSVAEMTWHGPRAERLRTATYVQKASGPVMTEPRPQGLFLRLPHLLCPYFSEGGGARSCDQQHAVALPRGRRKTQSPRSPEGHAGASPLQRVPSIPQHPPSIACPASLPGSFRFHVAATLLASSSLDRHLRVGVLPASLCGFEILPSPLSDIATSFGLCQHV